MVNLRSDGDSNGGYAEDGDEALSLLRETLKHLPPGDISRVQHSKAGNQPSNYSDTKTPLKGSKIIVMENTCDVKADGAKTARCAWRRKR